MAVRLEPLCSARRVTAPQAPLTAAAALPIHSSTGKVSIVVSLHDPSYFSLGLIRRLTCYRAAKLSTRFPQKTGVLRRSRKISPFHYRARRLDHDSTPFFLSARATGIAVVV